MTDCFISDTIHGNEFPIFSSNPDMHPLIYLDNAATTHKPRCVIDALLQYYSFENANVHRGLHRLSQTASIKYESARLKAGKFLGAGTTHEIIFTSGTTSAINLVAHGLSGFFVRAGDEVLITQLEHHSNIIPWQMLCRATSATLRVVPILESGDLDLDNFHRLLNERTKLVAMTHVSNVLGTCNPVRELCAAAHDQGALTLVDGAQSTAHAPINLQDMDTDFYVCSAHKMYGPTGIGLLCGRKDLLERMEPYQTGSGMVESVTFEKATWREVPAKFEAGTPPIAGAIGLAAALEYLDTIGIKNIALHEEQLLTYAIRALGTVNGLKIIGNPASRVGVISFTMDCAHPHDIAQLLDNEGIAIRSGHHCAQPLMYFYNVPATARVSLGIYNTQQDIDMLINALQKVRKVFA